METIILTKDIKEGLELKNTLDCLSNDFSSVKNYTKKDILCSSERFKDTFFIFSTWYMPVFTEEEVREYFPSLKAIFYAAGTVKYFADSFLNMGVRIFSAAKANAIPVAEFVTSQIILANKGYFQAQREYRKPFWRISFNKARNYTLQKKGNYQARIGIIGCGDIGSRVVELLKPYKLDVCIYDPYISVERVEELRVKRTDIKEIFYNCDVISNHLPNIPETIGMINYELLSLMKDNATFINTGRGEQVVERDLAKIMHKKPNACALLDVTSREPVWPWSQLLRRKNIFLTPHISGSLSYEKNRMVEYMITAYLNTIAGRSDISAITLEELNRKT